MAQLALVDPMSRSFRESQATPTLQWAQHCLPTLRKGRPGACAVALGPGQHPAEGSVLGKAPGCGDLSRS